MNEEHGFSCGHSNNVLQGVGSMHSEPELELLNGPSSDLTPGEYDPASLTALHFGPDAQILPHLSPGHAAFLNQWPPDQSTSSSPQSLDYSNYFTTRYLREQDPWSMLRVTGAPVNVTFSTRTGPVQRMGGFPAKRVTGHYSAPSESESHGVHSSDSGYSTQRSIAVSYAVDAACSPHLEAQEYEQDEKMVPLDVDSTDHGEAMNITERPETPSLLCHDAIKCDYPGCPWTGKCPSDKRKHEARHKKLFKCDEPNCTRKEGFGTINDLARHKKCVHKKEPERGPKVLYMCFGQNCPRSDKKWPRLDNFRQHLARMHNNEDTNELLRRSHEWYTNCVKPQDMVSVFADNLSEGTPSHAQRTPEPEILTQDTDLEFRGPIAPIHEAFQPSSMLTLDSIKRFDEEIRDINQVSPQTMELPTLKRFELEQSVEQRVCDPSQTTNQRHDKTDDMISEAAVSVINAMTKMINNHQRRRGYVGEEDIGEQEGELSDRNREILQKILVTASMLLSGDPGPDSRAPQENTNTASNKAGWVQCEFCPKQTRLRYEMKKHKKRHERPYACTFHRCDKTFGSKADWKRHEQSQHFGIQSWQCTLPGPAQGSPLCALVFNQEDAYTRHLSQQHQVNGEEVQTSICGNRLGWNGEPRFWCGFCRKTIYLQGDGFAAWNQRLNHIDIEHFRKGDRINDWNFPAARITKSPGQDDGQNIRDRLAGGESVGDDDGDTDSTCSGYLEHGSPHEYAMSVDQDLPFEPPQSAKRPVESGPFRSDLVSHRKRKPHNPLVALSLPPYIEKKSRTRISGFKRTPSTASLGSIRGR